MRGRWLVLCTMMVMGLGAGAAMAQLGGLAPPGSPDEKGASSFQGGKAPTPKKADPEPPVLMGYLAIIIIVGAVVGANMIPSKRGHQD